MEKGGGLSLWPKLALHLPMVNDVYPKPLHPCVFCKRGYLYFNIVIASCKHIYYIFCAVAVAKVGNRCIQCDEVFHPHWWQNFGFRGAYPGLEDETMRRKLQAQLEELKQFLKENSNHHVLKYKFAPCLISAYYSAPLFVFLCLFHCFWLGRQVVD